MVAVLDCMGAAGAQRLRTGSALRLVQPPAEGVEQADCHIGMFAQLVDEVEADQGQALGGLCGGDGGGAARVVTEERHLPEGIVRPHSRHLLRLVPCTAGDAHVAGEDLERADGAGALIEDGLTRLVLPAARQLLEPPQLSVGYTPE